ncbi:MAG TPA: polysaccharide biosynthesis/export family protein [Anaerohalosphaeraceae bacterium]|jgi:polysaccharide export outer membrane protein|nr:polysaccharide biosynthesis/export family protein [Anaerohalosphaeraceae bacterium]HRT51176.1 polysaccharide biosynthesis/export family protein [Anaerohalosphaeraceae bacterium]HRT87229.1 polysaccharide biosynthesis/export family protein [Anaerohalosphaeraceae bacterium]
MQTTAKTALTLTFFSVLLAGCGYNGPDGLKYFTKPTEIDVTADNYILQPPDEVEIRCAAIPELNLVRQAIRPDGKVTYEGIGEIHAAGRTPKELADIIREKAMTSYSLTGEHPIDVQIATYRSKLYYVVGQVYASGPKIFTGRDTVLKAIAGSRPTNGASIRHILVVRPSPDGSTEPRIFELDYKDMIAKGDTSRNVLLEEGDIIYVPPTILAAIGLTIDQLLRPVHDAATMPYLVQPLPLYPYGTR